MMAGKKLLAVFFLGVCVHEAYVVGELDKRRCCTIRS